MATKHSPAIRLQAARASLDLAYENCPHWDYESGPGHYACCCMVEEAKAELKKARKLANPTR